MYVGLHTNDSCANCIVLDIRENSKSLIKKLHPLVNLTLYPFEANNGAFHHNFHIPKQHK